MEPLERAGVLLDPQRLAVAGALAVGPRTTAELVDGTGVARPEVLAALGELRAAGFVTEEGSTYRLDPKGLRVAAEDLAERAIPMDAAIGFGMTDDEQEVLSRYFSGRTLTEIPASRAKRLVVLERLALEFDLGRRYSEAEVNGVLGAFHPDTSALRRRLVDEGFLDREPRAGGSQYWRSGGRTTLH